MREGKKTKKQLIKELTDLRQRNTFLERLVSEYKRSVCRDLMESIPIGISISTPEAQISEINSTVVDMFGYDSKESFSKLPASAHYYDLQDRERLIELLKEGSVKDFETRFKRKDGTVFWASLTSASRIVEGEAIQFINTFQDVTSANEQRRR